MDQTFISIHNLLPDANILFASESIADILGYRPDEIQGKPAFEYFHPDEVPFARSVHSRGILLDKAAVLHYLRIRAKDGQWMSCECCFTIVHDVLVACTSIYRRGEKSERRAIEAPQIRRIFSSSPLDPRYNMLEHLSPKFKMPPVEREPRAALIVNRFTRSHTVMFATNAITQLLGVTPDQINGKSFYECIQENCLNNAVQCLESAKANDSIAYLRFWYRDPRRDEDFDEEGLGDEEENRERIGSRSGMMNSAMDIDGVKMEGMEYFYTARSPLSLNSEASLQRMRRRDALPAFELEAVVSCTSDGLVVILRKARPPIPAPHPPLLNPFDYANGLFAAPWGQQPIRPYYPPELLYTFRPPLLPQYMPLRESVKAAGGPPLDQLMRSIQDVAVFAWALVGINGNIANYARGHPGGGAQPQDGLPVWDPSGSSEQRQTQKQVQAQGVTPPWRRDEKERMPLTGATQSYTLPHYNTTSGLSSSHSMCDSSCDDSTAGNMYSRSSFSRTSDWPAPRSRHLFPSVGGVTAPEPWLEACRAHPQRNNMHSPSVSPPACPSSQKPQSEFWPWQ